MVSTYDIERRRERERRERASATPEEREKANARGRVRKLRWRERLLQTEEGRAKLRATERRKYEIMRANDIDGYRARKARNQRAWYARQMPERIAAALERIAAAPKRISAAPPKVESVDQTLWRNALYAAAMRAIPRGIDAHHREDIAADIIVAVLSGECTIEDIPKHYREIAGRHWKMHGNFETVSLDAPVFDGVPNLVDTIDADAFHF